jgi:GMP synthase-like glutamine amidotransferase
MSSCLVVQHVAPERSFAIGEALDAAGVEIEIRRTFAAEPLPQGLEDFDGLVVMGGPMSATSDEGFPTRRHEIALLGQALELELPTLGVCLGSQLLATAAGGRVLRGSAGLEIGWAPVWLSAAAGEDPLLAAAPTAMTVLHWHGDTYDLPRGAVHLASSEQYMQQAFRVGDRAWGLQFHLEVDEVAVAGFVEAFGEDARRAGTTQTAIASATAGALRALGPHRDAILGRFAAIVADGVSCAGHVDELADLL